jgi:phage shock protein A
MDVEQALKDLKDDLVKVHAELAELRSRLARLESERVEAAADQV